jgi:hypothetical protein
LTAPGKHTCRYQREDDPSRILIHHFDAPLSLLDLPFGPRPRAMNG